MLSQACRIITERAFRLIVAEEETTAAAMSSGITLQRLKLAMSATAKDLASIDMGPMR